MEKLTYSVPEVVTATGIARSTIYAAMQSGQLQARKWGRRTLVTRAELDRFIAALPVGLDANDGPLSN